MGTKFKKNVEDTQQVCKWRRSKSSHSGSSLQKLSWNNASTVKFFIQRTSSQTSFLTSFLKYPQSFKTMRQKTALTGSNILVPPPCHAVLAATSMRHGGFRLVDSGQSIFPIYCWDGTLHWFLESWENLFLVASWCRNLIQLKGVLKIPTNIVKGNYSPLKLTARTWKWMVGISFWGPAYFQGLCLVSGRVLHL